MLQHLGSGAGAAEGVLDAHTAHRGGQLLTEEGTDRLSQAADDTVLFAGNDPAAGLGAVQHQFLVQRLHGSQVDHPDGDALGGQQLGGVQGLGHHEAVCQDGGIGALPKDLALADLEFKCGLVVDNGHGGPAEAHIDGALVLISGLDHGPGLHVVGGRHDHHAGNGAHEGKVLAALMGGTVLAHRQAAVGGADLHVQMGVAHGVPGLLEGTASGKHSKAGHEGHQSHGGGTGGGGHHIALGDAAIEVALREGLFKGARLGGAGQVGVKDHQVIMDRAQLLQGVAVAVPGGDLFHIGHLTSPPLLPAGPSAQSWPAHIPRRWAPCRASRPGSPYRRRPCPWWSSSRWQRGRPWSPGPG